MTPDDRQDPHERSKDDQPLVCRHLPWVDRTPRTRKGLLDTSHPDLTTCLAFGRTALDTRRASGVCPEVGAVTHLSDQSDSDRPYGSEEP